MSATQACHIVVGHESRPIWTCSETRTAVRDRDDILCEFVDRHDTAAQV
jgi:hypothetical protein